MKAIFPRDEVDLPMVFPEERILKKRRGRKSLPLSSSTTTSQLLIAWSAGNSIPVGHFHRALIDRRGFRDAEKANSCDGDERAARGGWALAPLLRRGSRLIYERAIKSAASYEAGSTYRKDAPIRSLSLPRTATATTSRNFPALRHHRGVLLSLRKLLPSHFARRYLSERHRSG